MGVTGLAIAQLFRWLMWGDRGQLNLLWSSLECLTEGGKTFGACALTEEK